MICWASLVAQKVKNPPAMQETCVQSLGWEDPLEKGSTWGTSHGACLEFPREADLILRGAVQAGNPFQTTQGNQLSCRVENPRDCGAWWAAVYGVAQSRIHQKPL